jgi:hypothetical protein
VHLVGLSVVNMYYKTHHLLCFVVCYKVLRAVTMKVVAFVSIYDFVSYF